MILSLVGWGVFAPLIVVLTLSLLLRAFRQGEEPGSFYEGFLPFIAYSVAYTGLAGWPPFPPIEATQWSLFLLCALALLNLMERYLPEGLWTWLVRVLFVCVSVFLLLRPRSLVAWNGMEMLVWSSGWSLCASLVWFLSHPPQIENRSAWSFAPILVAMAATNIALLLSGSALLSQLGGVGATILFSYILVNRSKLGKGEGVVQGSVVCLLVWVIILGQTYAYLPLSSSGLLMAAFASLGVSKAPFAKGWSTRKLVLVQLVLVLIFAFSALWMVPMPEPDPYGAYALLSGV